MKKQGVEWDAIFGALVSLKNYYYRAKISSSCFFLLRSLLCVKGWRRNLNNSHRMWRGLMMKKKVSFLSSKYNKIIIFASWVSRQLCVKQKSSIKWLKSIFILLLFSSFLCLTLLDFYSSYLTLRFTISDSNFCCLFPFLINAGKFFMSSDFLFLLPLFVDFSLKVLFMF